MKKQYKQTGNSNRKADLLFSAKSPGWRKSASGNIYFENRTNRTDKDKKKRL